MTEPTPPRLQALQRQATLRHHDFAAEMGLPEAALAEAGLHQGVLRLDPTPGRLLPAISRLGEVMAATRNRACLVERICRYPILQDGADVTTLRGAQIELRLDPDHWVHAYAVEAEGLRSVQIFDAAGDSVHKVHLGAASSLSGWQALCRDLVLPGPWAPVAFLPRAAPGDAPIDSAQADALRAGWAALTAADDLDPLIRGVNLDRLGACRLAGAPHARQLPAGACAAMLHAIRGQGLEVRLRVENPGCAQIRSGPIRSLRPMGPLLNVVDARFSLHLHTDQLAEVWLLQMPTRHGPVLSVEAFDAGGAPVLRCSGLPPEEGGDAAAWPRLVAGLPERRGDGASGG